MTKKKMRKCAVCRTEYTYCNRCQEDKDKPTWYFTFCSSNCKDIYDATSKFENGQLTEDEAKKILDKLDLSKVDNFGQSYKSSITKINAAKIVIEEEKGIEEQVVDKDDKPSYEFVEEKENKKPKRANKNIE